MSEDDALELAIRYVKGRCAQDEEKMRFFHLLLTDDDFKRLVRETLAWIARLEQEKIAINPDLKREWLAAVKEKSASASHASARNAYPEALPLEWLGRVLDLVLPGLAVRNYPKAIRRLML